MPIVYKILGQVAPAATTDTPLYSVPSGGSALVSTVTITNRGSSAGTFRVRAAKSGEGTVANKQYIAFDTPIEANSFITLTLGLTLSASEALYVYGSTGDFSFNAFGQETTA